MNRIQPELLIYYSINAILRRNVIDESYITALQSSLNKYSRIKIDGITIDPTYNYIFSLKHKQRFLNVTVEKTIYEYGLKIGSGTQVDESKYYFQIDKVFTINMTDYTYTLKNKFSNTEYNLSSLLIFSKQKTLRITSSPPIITQNFNFIGWCIESTRKSDNAKTIVSDVIGNNNKIQTSFTYTYEELYAIFRLEFSNQYNETLNFEGSNITGYNLKDYTPPYRSINSKTDNIEDIYNFIMFQQFYEGYYHSLGEKIKREILMFDFDVTPYTIDNDIITFKPIIKFVSDNNFTNFLYYKYQECLYLEKKYNMLYNKCMFYLNNAIYDAINGKTNLGYINSLYTNENLYKILDATAFEIESDTRVNEIIAFSNINTYIEHLKNDIPSILDFTSYLDEGETQHYNYFFEASLNSAIKYELKHSVAKHGKPFDAKYNKLKYDICSHHNGTSNVYTVCNTNDVIDEYEDGSNWNINEYKSLNKYGILLFSCFSTTWNSTIATKCSTLSLTDGISELLQQYATYLSTYITETPTFQFRMKLISIYDYYLFQLRNSTEIIRHEDDIYNIIHIFTGIDSNIPSIVELRNFFQVELPPSVIFPMCHAILCGIVDLIEVETTDTTEMSEYLLERENESKVKQFVTLESENLSTIVSKIDN